MAGAESSRMGGVIPFLIDWGATPHPGSASPPGCRLIELRAEHPDAARAAAVLGEMGLDLKLDAGATPRLSARLATPRGEIEL